MRNINSNQKILLKKLKSFKKVIFVSPHLDDAVFSAGSLIYELARNTPVKVVTIFTKSDKLPETLSAKRFTQKSGYSDSKKLFEDRKKEDIRALSLLGANYCHLDFIDALWRKRGTPNRITKFIPEFYHTYPVFRIHATTGKISMFDQPLLEKIKKDLIRIVGKDTLIFAPLGIGYHVDHLITRKVCDKLTDSNIIYWLDYPYSLTAMTVDPLIPTDVVRFVYKKHSKKKRESMFGYSSQIKAIFPKGYVPKLPDVYYIKPDFVLK